MTSAKQGARRKAPQTVVTWNSAYKIKGEPVFDKQLAALPKATRRRFHMSWLIDPTERWLNQQAAAGWAVVDCGPLRFGFAPSQPGEYQVRCQLLPGPYFDPDVQDYLATLQDSGAEVVYIGLDTFLIARRRAALGPFELYSDLDSRIGYLERLRSLVRTSIWQAVAGLAVLPLVFSAGAGLGGALARGDGFWWSVRDLWAWVAGEPLLAWFVGLLAGACGLCGAALAVTYLWLGAEASRWRKQRAIQE
ncbi:MAG: DUF2812 domain-containing protein [Bifidobacteriaceae bacterium]|jgi:hypothetical protein|nr:DUF2812 domain-containing protein [Bifidobacteriaceae bacterium]